MAVWKSIVMCKHIQMCLYMCVCVLKKTDCNIKEVDVKQRAITIIIII